MALQSSTNYSLDLSSGPEIAHRLGQERSQTESGVIGSLWGGDLKSALASHNRIRELKKYLRDLGYYDGSIPAIPSVRPNGVSISVSQSMPSEY
jgi:hypothetical protein